MFRGRILKGREPALFGMPSFDLGQEMRAGEAHAVGLEHETERIEREAYEKGFETGEKAGYTMGEQKADVLVERLRMIMEEMKTLKDQMEGELVPQVFELAVAIAKKVVMDELKAQPETIMRIVKEAIKRLERSGPITIKVNPSLQELFMRKKSELLDLHPEIVLDVDPSVPPTGPLVVGTSDEIVTDMDELLSNVIDDMGGHPGAS